MKYHIFFKIYIFFVLITGVSLIYTYSAFAEKKYTITASSGEHGKIEPSGDVPVKAGKEITFTMHPDPGYVIDNVVISGISVGAVSSWRFLPVNKDHTINVTFKLGRIPQYVIIATSGEHGKIEPKGEVIIDEEDKLTFIITPEPGYIINDVLVNKKSVGTKNSYTFSSVKADQTIQALFKKDIQSKEAIKLIKISGSVSDEKKTPLCAMILANGQYIFSCGEKSIGKYELKVPPDKNNEITLFGFCDGLAPFKQVLKVSGDDDIKADIKMSPALPDSKKMILTPGLGKGVKNPEWTKISGVALYEGKPLSIMVLANGQYIFTDIKDGKYQFEAPLDKEKQITFFGFCDGFLPFKQVLTP